MADTVLTKICKICKEEKLATTDYFYGRENYCRLCQKERRRKKYIENSEILKEKSRNYTKNNKEKISIYKKEYYIKNKERERENDKIYYENNKEKILQQKREYYHNNIDKIKEHNRHYYNKNKSVLNQKCKIYRQNNKKSIAEKKQIYNVVNKKIISDKYKVYYLKNRDRLLFNDRIYKGLRTTKDRRNIRSQQRRKEDVFFKLINNFSISFRSFLKNNKIKLTKNFNFNKYQLINHIESQFVEGMNWENYGTEWHIDHKRPISSFNILNICKAWELKNLQPLWADLNCSKQNEWDGTETNESICLQYQNDPRPWLLEKEIVND
jgi:hypothetical protein